MYEKSQRLSLQSCVQLLSSEVAASEAEKAKGNGKSATLEVRVLIEAYERLREEIAGEIMRGVVDGDENEGRKVLDMLDLRLVVLEEMEARDMREKMMGRRLSKVRV